MGLNLIPSLREMHFIAPVCFILSTISPKKINVFYFNATKMVYPIRLCLCEEAILAWMKQKVHVQFPLDAISPTPLHWAVIERLEKIASYLIQKGANVNHQNRWGETPFHASVYMEQQNALIDMLICGADPAIKAPIFLRPLWKKISQEMSDHVLRGIRDRLYTARLCLHRVAPHVFGGKKNLARRLVYKYLSVGEGESLKLSKGRLWITILSKYLENSEHDADRQF